MARVTGVGGVFLKSADPKALGAWYAKHLGVAWIEDCDGHRVELCERPMICVSTVDCRPHCGCMHDSDCPGNQTCGLTVDCGGACSGSE